jgi:hypothetical protein
MKHQTSLDEKTADEESEFEGREESEVFEGKLLAGLAIFTSLADLENERIQVNKLLELAGRVYEQGQESKFERLRQVLRERNSRTKTGIEPPKMIIFTEHRDTLDFLVRRLEGIGSPGR